MEVEPGWRSRWDNHAKDTQDLLESARWRASGERSWRGAMCGRSGYEGTRDIGGRLTSIAVCGIVKVVGKNLATVKANTRS